MSTSRPGTFELTEKLLDLAKMKMEWRSFRSLPRGGGRWLKQAEK